MPLSKEALVAAAKINRSHRNFKLTLQELCLRTVAENEQFYVNRMENFITYRMPSTMKQLVLSELSRKVVDMPRYKGGQLRVEFVKLLIFPGLEQFSFAVCNSKRLDRHQDLWKCLVTKAGKSLRSVHDVRKYYISDSCPGSWCLHYLAKMPNLEELRLTSMKFTAGGLDRLADAIPNVKRLQISSPARGEFLKEKIAFSKFNSLEEFQLADNSKMDSTNSALAKWLLLTMPKLTVGCFRVDRPYPPYTYLTSVDKVASFVQGESSLEHAALSGTTESEQLSILRTKFGNVKHLLLQDDCIFTRHPIEDLTLSFKNLSTLHLFFYEFSNIALPLLRINGQAVITTLILHSTSSYPAIDLFLPLECCPYLTKLCVGGDHGVSLKVSQALDHKRLTELTLIKGRAAGVSFLSRVLQAPLLQKLSLVKPEFRFETYQRATKDLASGTLSLSQLQSFDFSPISYRTSIYRTEFVQSARDFVQHVLSLSPKLSEAKVNMNNANERQPQPFLNMVNYPKF